jgi:hypothetical protein
MTEVTLFDGSGNPDAYLAPQEENTFYLWSGQPVAYLDSDNIYGFNGKHLGWFEQGIVWDHSGSPVGFTRQTIQVYAKYEPYKAYKQYRPYRAYQQYAPYKPYFKTSISATPLAAFLAAGR